MCIAFFVFRNHDGNRCQFCSLKIYQRFFLLLPSHPYRRGDQGGHRHRDSLPTWAGEHPYPQVKQQPLSTDSGCFLALGLFAEGHAIGALILFGIALVGADLDAIQTAIILTTAVIGAGGDGAVDAAIGFLHIRELLSCGYLPRAAQLVCP